jgi:hypothetical protein
VTNTLLDYVQLCTGLEDRDQSEASVEQNERISNQQALLNHHQYTHEHQRGRVSTPGDAEGHENNPDQTPGSRFVNIELLSLKYGTYCIEINTATSAKNTIGSKQ